VTKKSSPKTFHCNGLTLELHPEVYEPAEDTFQLLEALKIKRDDTILEIGTGCGMIALDCARRGAHVVCTDLNPYAVALTKRNIQRNIKKLKGHIEVRHGDLFKVLQQNERFNIVIFNPPYLPTKPSERIGGTGLFDLATDGGPDGLSITKRFIEELPEHIEKNGCAYLVFSSLSDKKKFVTILKKIRVQADVVLSRRFDDETLDIYRLQF
jgi:release factor glutamine methyltransferase